MNTKHSPGPWAVFDGGRGNQKLIVNEATTIAQTMCGNDKANAQLISAAPMLLEALVAMRTVMDMGSKPSKLDAALTWRECDEKARSMCDAAIAAATGETK
jgi:hypothetical protein